MGFQIPRFSGSGRRQDRLDSRAPRALGRSQDRCPSQGGRPGRFPDPFPAPAAGAEMLRQDLFFRGGQFPVQVAVDDFSVRALHQLTFSQTYCRRRGEIIPKYLPGS